VARAGPAISAPKTLKSSGGWTAVAGRFRSGPMVTHRACAGRTKYSRPTTVTVHSRPPPGLNGWYGRRSADARAPHCHAQRKQQTPCPASQKLRRILSLLFVTTVTVVRLLRLNHCCLFPVPP